MLGPGIPRCECLQDEGWTEESGGVQKDHDNWNNNNKINLLCKSSIFLLVKLQCRRILWEHSKELGVWSEETPKETENQSEQRRVRTHKIYECITVL